VATRLHADVDLNHAQIGMVKTKQYPHVLVLDEGVPLRDQQIDGGAVVDAEAGSEIVYPQTAEPPQGSPCQSAPAIGTPHACPDDHIGAVIGRDQAEQFGDIFGVVLAVGIQSDDMRATAELGVAHAGLDCRPGAGVKGQLEYGRARLSRDLPSAIRRMVVHHHGPEPKGEHPPHDSPHIGFLIASRNHDDNIGCGVANRDDPRTCGFRFSPRKGLNRPRNCHR